MVVFPGSQSASCEGSPFGRMVRSPGRVWSVGNNDRDTGVYYHGAPESHVFLVVKRPFGDSVAPSSKMLWEEWSAARHTAVEADRFCGNCKPLGRDVGADVYECLGHSLVGEGEKLDHGNDPALVRRRLSVLHSMLLTLMFRRPSLRTMCQSPRIRSLIQGPRAT